MTQRRNREAVAAAAMLGQPREDKGDAWWRGALIYEVYVRSFRDSDGDGLGDLRGVLEKLDYIAGLGVDALWLSPFYPSPQKDFGYDITDLRNVDPCAGSLDDVVALIEAAHARGLRVLLDFVAPHTSEEHPWFLESRASRDNERADWYVWADSAADGTPPNNWLSSFGGPAWTWEPRRSQYYYHPFLSCQPALNLLNPAVFDAIAGEMRFWLDLGVDGFRLDAVQTYACDPDLRDNPPVSEAGPDILLGGGPNNPFAKQSHLFDRDRPEALGIVEQMRAVVDAYDPPRVLIGELADMDSSRLTEKYTQDDRMLHAAYDFDLINTPPEAGRLIELLRRRRRFMPTGWILNAFSNHDATRAVSNLTAFACEAGRLREAAKMLLFLQVTLRGGAVIYQGEELGLPHPELDFEDLRDPWGINLWPDFEGRDASRTPMPWLAEGDGAGFTDGEEPWLSVAAAHRPLAVAKQEDDPDSVLAFFRSLVTWRRAEPVLLQGDEEVHGDDRSRLIVYDRFDETRRLKMAVNFSTDLRFLPVDPAFIPIGPPGAVVDRTEHGVELPPLGFAALAADDPG